MHYNCQSEEDLKKIYDKVMGDKIGLEVILRIDTKYGISER